MNRVRKILSMAKQNSVSENLVINVCGITAEGLHANPRL